MQDIQRILHPTNFASGEVNALAYAFDLALRLGATLEVLHVVAHQPASSASAITRMEGPEGEQLRVRLRQETIQHLSGWGLDALERVPIQYTIIGGAHPAAVLLAYLGQQGVDLVVMGTHGRRGIGRLLMGSVTEALVREAPCPVLTVRYQAASDPVQVARILVPIDFSPVSIEVLTYARRLAGAYGAALTLLFIAEEQVVTHFSDTGLPSFTLMKMDEDVVDRAEVALKALFDQSVGPACEVAYVVRRGVPGYHILEAADGGGHDLIVLATRGLSGFAYGLLGSVTHHVVRAAPCPVFVCKDPVEEV